jgi:ribosomal protein L37E
LRWDNTFIVFVGGIKWKKKIGRVIVNKPIYTNTCIRCGDKFDTYHAKHKYCPACEEEFKDEKRERTGKR